ncbi:folylpolyglutamate synthase/dihydrofolate synthase family protein [Demequina sp. NBRC 110057]|uniref:bifunctional folylpolyglutamate synthase/dihydrofolate synthase n=1 Tax=Demequina sp. NBRC 110057 TaxID=1570346 RepID=UPI0013563B7D|nr:Mur ligase family protein [Demequina sp. NBRC 110057]
MNHPSIAGLSPADAEREIDALIFSRSPESDHAAKLRRVSAALARLGDPHRTLRIVHVTGTNGKTSTSRMIESLLRAHGLTTGLFTSPHLTTFRERIQIDGQPLAQEALVRLWERVSPVIQAIDNDSLAGGGPRMSFFEILTVLGFTAYADAGVDVAVIEVGIGGSRDATNVGDGEVAVLTPMAEDHSNYFVGGITGVASEKSGIIKEGATVVSAMQPEVAEDIIRAAAATAGAVMRWEGVHHEVLGRAADPAGQVVRMRTMGAVSEALVPLHGDFQAQNAMIALGAVEAFLERFHGVPASEALDAEAVARGFAGATSPGRLEVISDQPTVVVDAAHNPHGVEALAATLPEAFGFSTTVGVIAVLADKDGDGILAGLSSVVDHVVVTQTDSPRATPVDVLAAAAREVWGGEHVTVAPTVAEALDVATEMALGAGPDAGVLIAGSITLVAAARKVVQREHLAQVKIVPPRLADAGESSTETIPA